MQHLKNILLLFLLLFSIPGSAQTEKVRNLMYVDQRRVHFGFMLGLHAQDLSFRHSGFVTADGETWFAEIPHFSPGFAVGLVGDLAFTERINLRFTPSMYFGSKYVEMREIGSKEKVTQDIKSNYLAFPVSIRYSARRVNNYRPYLITGVSPSFDLSKRKDTPLVLKRFDTALEIGFGCDLYLPYFKLIPELKFSFGLLDVLEHNRKDLRDPTMIKYTQALNKVKSRMVVLSFYFE
ncbi:MAG: porin family protein [Bacteroidales bacterium]